MDSSYQGYTSMIYQRVQRVQTYLPGLVTMKEMPTTFLCRVTVTCHKFSQEGESSRAITANSKDGNRQRTSILLNVRCSIVLESAALTVKHVDLKMTLASWRPHDSTRPVDFENGTQ